MTRTLDRRLLPGNADNLRDALDVGIPIFVLIDPLVGEPIFVGDIENDEDPLYLREKVWQRRIQGIRLHKSCRLPLHQHPYLVRLEGVTDPLLELTINLAISERHDASVDGLDGEGIAAHRIGGWLQSSMAPMELSSHISSLLRVRTEEPTTATYLRLVDRRTLALLCHIVGVARVTAQMGRLQSWCFLDVLGNLVILKSSDEDPRPLHLTAAEWKNMQDGVALNRALAQWIGEAERIGDRYTLKGAAHELYAPLTTALRAAEQMAREHPHRFQTLSDQTICAALNMLQPSLSQSSAVRKLLATGPTPGTSAEPFRYIYREIYDLLNADGSNIPRRSV